MFKGFMKTSLLALVTLILVACGEKQTDVKGDNWDSYQSTKSITVGFDNTFVPMGFEDEDGKIVGFDVDLAEAVFAEYDIDVNWQPINWDLKEEELTNGNIDLIWNGYTMTDERAKKVLFSNPYMETEETLVVSKEDKIPSVSDMKDKVLGAQAGSSSYDAFLANPELLQDIVKDNDAILYDTFTQAFMDLETKRNDAILVDKVYANYYLKQNGKLDQYELISAGLESSYFGVGARLTDKTLVSKINDAFSKLYKDGKYQEISNKWFGEDTATDIIKE